MERTTSRFGTVDLIRIDKLPLLWPPARSVLYSNRACFGGWRRASDALDRQTIAGETMSSCESLQLEKSIPFLKSFQEIQETRKQCGANGSFHFVFHIHRSPGTVAIRCTSISRLPRREWEYTRDGILCYVLFGSGPREAAFIKGFVDECMCESLDRIAVCPCARACKLLFVENHPIPSTHLEATRLRDSLPSRGGSSLIITEILMA